MKSTPTWPLLVLLVWLSAAALAFWGRGVPMLQRIDPKIEPVLVVKCYSTRAGWVLVAREDGYITVVTNASIEAAFSETLDLHD